MEDVAGSDSTTYPAVRGEWSGAGSDPETPSFPGHSRGLPSGGFLQGLSWVPSRP